MRKSMLGRLGVVLSAALLIACLSCTSRPAITSDEALGWVGTWTSAPMAAEPRDLPPSPPGLADSTLRQIVHVSIGGNELRVRFSNAFGKSPLTITSAHIARATGGSAIEPASDTALSFSGRESATISAGALVWSDPVQFELAPLSDVAVTIQVTQAPDDLTVHPASHCTSYLQPGEAVSAPEMPDATPTEHWYLLNGIDVRTGGSAAAVAALGDSITDGSGSTTNENQRWPDFLARRLAADPATREIGVLNLGIGGNRILNDGRGPNALARLDRDILAQDGVRWLIVFEGINDIGTRRENPAPEMIDATAERLIAALDQIIERAHSRGIRVYGATILACEGSFYFTPEREVERQKVNDWIRTGGQFDAVLDFDAATRDPQKPTALAADLDSGDHLHLNDAGYKALADSIDLSLLAKQAK